jgi:hypothetical protein
MAAQPGASHTPCATQETARGATKAMPRLEALLYEHLLLPVRQLQVPMPAQAARLQVVLAMRRAQSSLSTRQRVQVRLGARRHAPTAPRRRALRRRYQRMLELAATSPRQPPLLPRRPHRLRHRLLHRARLNAHRRTDMHRSSWCRATGASTGLGATGAPTCLCPTSWMPQPSQARSTPTGAVLAPPARRAAGTRSRGMGPGALGAAPAAASWRWLSGAGTAAATRNRSTPTGTCTG